MATRTLLTTDDAPTLPTDSTDAWPAFDRDHDPEPLATNEPRETTQRTLADFGGIVPTKPDRPQFPTDTRDHTEQTSVFEYTTEWWRDADRLEELFDERDLEIAEITDLLGDDIGYEVVRSNLDNYEIRDPTEHGSLADRLAATDPEDVGLSPTTDDSHAKFTKRGESA